MKTQQKGSALLVTLVILLALTIVGASALNSSVVDLKVSRNVSDIIKSNQQADAGIDLLMSLARVSYDPFVNRVDKTRPFYLVRNNNKLDKLNSNNGAPTVRVSTTYISGDNSCGRSEKGSSIGMIQCDHYLAKSAVIYGSNSASSAPTEVYQGVRREIIGR